MGYLLAGSVIGPATPGFVADVALAGQLAEIGVMLLMLGASLAQIGEFSFILAGALISIALNSLLFGAIDPLQAWLRKRSALARRLKQPDDSLAELPLSVELALGMATRVLARPAPGCGPGH